MDRGGGFEGFGLKFDGSSSPVATDLLVFTRSFSLCYLSMFCAAYAVFDIIMRCCVVYSPCTRTVITAAGAAVSYSDMLYSGFVIDMSAILTRSID